MDAYLSVLVKRLVPAAAEINAYRDDGQILGYARDASGALLPWPTMDEFKAEWASLQKELGDGQPQPEPSIAELEDRVRSLEDVIVGMVTGEMTAQGRATLERLRSRAVAKRIG